MPELLLTAPHEEYVEGVKGLRLFIRSWQPAGTPRATIVIVPGFNSHGGYYGWTAEQLVAQGLAVYTIDLRGRGRSDGERFYIESFADYLSDVSTVVTLARTRAPHLPLYLFGHSAGGVIACSYTVEHQAGLAGLICESFAFRVPSPDFALAVLKGLSHIAPHAHVLRLKNEDFSRDPGVVAAMNADPLIAHEVQPTLTVAEMVRADERLAASFDRITLPVLILHGTEDKVTMPGGSQTFFEKAGSADKTLKLYEGHAHDLLNDEGREQVSADIIEWLAARLPRA